ncbi:MAG: D-alanyl-D-alanine carboxypeptidase/D-alanyl-D-alanine-endopeptidase [Planctomycetota bacterium]|nr:D-alanyl-D-alanine carboxypeptidase/D-alanyl-D-alanine-endopeptidase [Planctomycetota bacterium]
MRTLAPFLAVTLALCGCSAERPESAAEADVVEPRTATMSELDPFSFDALIPRGRAGGREAGAGRSRAVANPVESLTATPSPVAGAATEPAAHPAAELTAVPAAMSTAGPAALDETRRHAGGGEPLAGEATTVDEGLSRAVEGAVATALQRARKASKGKVHGDNTVVSVMAIDASTGRILVQRLSEFPLVPASNLKLMTAAAALAELGAEGAFVTEFLIAATVVDGVLQGDLVVRAGGDPMHSREGDGSLARWLDPLAEALGQRGIRRVEGALVLDEGQWLEPGPGPMWPASSQHWRDYCGLAGGFSANGGCFRATVTPGAAGARAGVVLRPRHHGLTRKGSVTTAGSRVAVNVGANRGGVTVRGKIKAGSRPYVAEFSHPDPVELFGEAAVGGLADRGLIIEQGYRRARGVVLEEPVERVAELRTPITSVMQAILLDSNNPVADQLFLATGAAVSGAGTREAGANAVRASLARLGLNTRPLVQVDGSGLSKANRATAQQLAALVAAVIHQGGVMRTAILDALPVAGRTGKLAGRMRGTAAEGRVRAKTGWVKGASGLSGVAETAQGEEVVFSILVGYPLVDGLNTAAWKPMQDEICVALAGWAGDGAQKGAQKGAQR